MENGHAPSAMGGPSQVSALVIQAPVAPDCPPNYTSNGFEHVIHIHHLDAPTASGKVAASDVVARDRPRQSLPEDPWPVSAGGPSLNSTKPSECTLEHTTDDLHALELPNADSSVNASNNSTPAAAEQGNIPGRPYVINAPAAVPEQGMPERSSNRTDTKVAVALLQIAATSLLQLATHAGRSWEYWVLQGILLATVLFSFLNIWKARSAVICKGIASALLMIGLLLSILHY